MNCKSRTPCWVNVDERLPDVGQPVLCWPPRVFEGPCTMYTAVLRQHGEKQWFVCEGNCVVYNHTPTHWHPMPNPPNSELGGGIPYGPNSCSTGGSE